MTTDDQHALTSSASLGGSQRASATVDHFDWGRNALHFCHMDEAGFDQLARKIGKLVAFEILLLAVARRVGKDSTRIARARSLGIPLTAKSWSGLSALMSHYNNTICDTQPVPAARMGRFQCPGLRQIPRIAAGILQVMIYTRAPDDPTRNEKTDF